MQVTQDDIRRTYGGGTRTSSYSSSTNAYMLMYRRVDKEHNCIPLPTDQFPQWIQVRGHSGAAASRAFHTAPLTRGDQGHSWY